LIVLPNPVAKDLHRTKYRQRVVQDKRDKHKQKELDNETKRYKGTSTAGLSPEYRLNVSKDTD
jgi:hypothetical protein